MILGAEIIVENKNLFHVHGSLNFNNVASIEIFGCKLIKKSSAPVFDLAKITNSDNAALATLIAWTRFAKRSKKKLTFINVGQQLINLATMSGLIKLLPITK
jgi:ABC-type transporter Mla MlaB component